MLPSLAGVPGAELAILAMAFAWGATLGSFINVVVHRVPRRQSVVVGASRCPACATPILPRDNVPVVGWILLRGRCRGCDAAISPRYPLVEALCGAIACGVAAVEVVGGGGSLPWLGSSWPGIDRLLMHGDFRLAASWALHTGILLVVVAWSLLAALPAPHRVSPPAAWTAIVVVVAIIVALPDVGPPGVAVDGTRWPESARPAAVVAAALGIAMGLGVGGVTGRANDRWSLAIVGAALGWQTLTVVAIVTAVVRSAMAACRGHGAGGIDPLPAVAMTAVLFWRPIRAAWGWLWGCDLPG